MNENLELGLQLLLVGMLSVFFILAVVIGLARLLIYAVNTYAPEMPGPGKYKTRSADARHVAVLTATVDLITKGKGVIRSVKKI